MLRAQYLQLRHPSETFLVVRLYQYVYYHARMH